MQISIGFARHRSLRLCDHGYPHYHTILRTRPDIVALWPDREVATPWLTLFPRHRDIGGVTLPPAEEDIRALADCPQRIAQLRRRLSSLSWFMGWLNEFIARAAK